MKDADAAQAVVAPPPAGRPKRYKPSHDSRLSLMMAAEELTAKEGLGSLSARKVTRGASLKNNSSVQYHFGSLETLLRELTTYRMLQINELRDKMIRNYGVDLASCDLDTVIKVLYLPHLELAKLGPKEANHAAFLSQYLPSILSASLRWPTWERPLTAPTLLAVNDALRSRLNDLSPAQFDRRASGATTLFLGTVHAVSQNGLFMTDPEQADEIIEDTLAQCKAMLLAPKLASGKLRLTP